MPDVTLTLRKADAERLLPAVIEGRFYAVKAHRLHDEDTMEIVDSWCRMEAAVKAAIKSAPPEDDDFDFATPAAGMAEELEGAE